MSLPSTMQALQLSNYSGLDALILTETPMPQPGHNDVLVKILATTANPSDLHFMKGEYGFTKPLPVVPGFEGCGLVVAAGEGAESLQGQRVACFAAQDKDGTWAEYMVTGANNCFPLQDHVTDEQGTTMLVNPFTAIALLNLAQEAGAKAVVQTAAAGQVGRMVQRLCNDRAISCVNIVRREEQVTLLKGDGAPYVLNSSEDGFFDTLRQTCRELKVSYAFDAVGGRMTGMLLEAIRRGGTVNVYGVLSGKPASLNGGQLIFGDKTVTGFWLSRWFARQERSTALDVSNQVQELLDDTLQSAIQGYYTLATALDGLRTYEDNMTAGKVIIQPAVTTG
ncbi:MAG: zinc-binding dehydrogenase [Chloroflexi bacterium]|nr:zinc-binding dehydrogenase [Chloroflexota bacterium]